MTIKTYEAIGYGITRIETGLVRPGLAACYVMQHENEVAIIETGTHHTVATIMAFLESNKIEPEQVRYVIPTHVHLDHAGGVGGLMARLPKAKLVIHPKGARHMIAPEKLKAGALEVYGEEKFSQMYGDIIPVAEDRVIVAEDNDTADLNGRILKFLDTPGHARHHFCVYDAVSEGVFTGDTFGLSYPELVTQDAPFLMPTTTPVQFEPEPLKASISKLMSLAPKRMFLTHYGLLESPEKWVDSLIEQINAYVTIAEHNKHSENLESDLTNALTQYTLEKLKSHATSLSESELHNLIKMDMTLNAQGLAVWLSRQ
ncbi:MAG: MBL fold metallo-hydrolase [Pseudomonadales bacterium]|nr:MBL fold metallo-hydrolase [Pseudomonadales bacterium]